MACVWQRMLLSPRSYSQRLYGMLERQTKQRQAPRHTAEGCTWMWAAVSVMERLATGPGGISNSAPGSSNMFTPVSNCRRGKPRAPWRSTHTSAHHAGKSVIGRDVARLGAPQRLATRVARYQDPVVNKGSALEVPHVQQLIELLPASEFLAVVVPSISSR